MWSAGGLRAWTFPLSLEAGPLHSKRYGLSESGRRRHAHHLRGFCRSSRLSGGARIGGLGVFAVLAGGTWRLRERRGGSLGLFRIPAEENRRRRGRESVVILLQLFIAQPHAFNFPEVHFGTLRASGRCAGVLGRLNGVLRSFNGDLGRSIKILQRSTWVFGRATGV